MGKDNVLGDKSFAFALRIVKLYKFLTEEKKEFILSKQVLRSGTSIGANIEESIGAQSTKDFVAKLHVSLKEAKETHYWIRLLRDSEYLTKEQSNSLLNDTDALISLLTKSLKTIKTKQTKEKNS